MTGREEHGPAEAPPRGIVARLSLDPGESLCGKLELEGVDGGTLFAGWIELMAAIDAARGRPQP